MSSTSGSEAKAQAPATGERVDGRVPVRKAAAAESLRHAAGAGVVFHGGQRGRHRLLDGEAGRELRILGDVAELNAAAKGAGTAIG